MAPSIALSQSETVAPGTATITPTCSSLGGGTLSRVNTRGNLATDWVPAIYSTTVDQDGWTLYQLPDGAVPWGPGRVFEYGLGEPTKYPKIGPVFL